METVIVIIYLLTNTIVVNGPKASMNSMANHGTGGRSVDGSRHCRFQICSENRIIQTLTHIRGAYPKAELLCNSSHHQVRTSIANLFC